MNVINADVFEKQRGPVLVLIVQFKIYEMNWTNLCWQGKHKIYQQLQDCIQNMSKIITVADFHLLNRNQFGKTKHLYILHISVKKYVSLRPVSTESHKCMSSYCVKCISVKGKNRVSYIIAIQCPSVFDVDDLRTFSTRQIHNLAQVI